ncbi:MAG: PHP domain-containing protein [Syntrophomonas sp.]
MIDLHMHTVNSDGTLTVEEILKEAQRKNISIISITDHNTIEAYHQIKKINIKDFYAGRIIYGVEVNCVFNGYRIELLGYDFANLNFLESWLKLNYCNEKEVAFRTREYEKLLNKMKDNGIVNNCSTSYDPKGKLPHTLVYNELKTNEQNKKYFSKEEWSDFSIFFRTATIDKNSLFYIDYSDILPTAKKVSAIIHEAGGKVFLAHAFSYNMDNHMRFIEDLVKDKVIDGIEVFYSTFTNEQSKKLYDYCQNNNLFMSGGSDFHVNRRGSSELGNGFGNLNVPEDILKCWLNS